MVKLIAFCLLLKVFQSVLDKAPDSKEVAVCMPIDTAEPPLKEPPVNGDAIVKAFGVLAVIVISALPLKLTPFIFLAVCNVVAVVELPLNAPVIVPASKLPLASLATIDDAVFKFVALVDELATLPAVVMVFNLLSAIEPASIVLLTLPTSPLPIKSPLVVGKVKVVVPAIAGACIVAVPLVAPAN